MSNLWSLTHSILRFKFKNHIAKQFTDSISRIARSKIHSVQIKFQRRFQPKHQEGRLVPNKLQERVNTEIEKLPEEGHIKKLL